MEYQEYIEHTQSSDKTLALRCYAAFIDYLLFFGIFYGYLYLFGEYQPDGSLSVNGIGHLLLIFCIWLFFFPLMETMFGYTLGKGLFDLKVIYLDKKEYHFVSSLKRHLLDIIDFQFFGAVGIILIKFTNDHKRLGDLWGKTTIVKDE